jgi:CO/xanthine dehydrogenase FAD-binding subunit
VARALRAAVEPEDDARIPAEFRRELAETLTQRALARALQTAQGGAT